MNSKEKGNRFEREIARKLSLWISEGKDKNLLWRSDSSGARATQNRKNDLSSQAGDIAADSKIGYDFVETFLVECKHRKSINIENLVYRTNKQENVLTWWFKYKKQAKKYSKNLMLICRQNNKKDLLFVDSVFLSLFEVQRKDVIVSFKDLDMNILYFDKFTDIYDFKRLYIGIGTLY